MSLFSWFSDATASPAEVRAEIWRLGTRHHGEPLQGALAELKAGGLPPRQEMILRACARKLQAG